MKNTKFRSKYKSGSVDRGFIILISIFTLLAVWFCVLMSYLCIKDIRNSNDSYKKAYAVWVKQDGNSKNLTYEEWRSLIAVDPRLVLKEPKN